ncbi:MAG: hypothetical protein HOJ88_08690 [Proteobacteria bacterium]|jgi:methionyl-tRNA formyltransferase|nr:hypothetical protein [Pseudomonadota bacterium]
MTVSTKFSILLLGKKDDEGCAKAVDFVETHFSKVEVHLGSWGDPLPDSVELWEGDYIFSYLSRWVLPAIIIEKARVAAINFHPASPDYPGIGCNNFALYEGATEFGVTCHYMANRVDTGNIVAVKRFPVYSKDDVCSLLKRTYDCQLDLFREILALILSGRSLPNSNETWSREPFTREELNDLALISPDMNKDEISRRVRATNYREFRPCVELAGYVFELVSEK